MIGRAEVRMIRERGLVASLHLAGIRIPLTRSSVCMAWHGVEWAWEALGHIIYLGRLAYLGHFNLHGVGRGLHMVYNLSLHLHQIQNLTCFLC